MINDAIVDQMLNMLIFDSDIEIGIYHVSIKENILGNINVLEVKAGCCEQADLIALASLSVYINEEDLEIISRKRIR